MPNGMRFKQTLPNSSFKNTVEGKKIARCYIMDVFRYYGGGNKLLGELKFQRMLYKKPDYSCP